MKPNNFQDFLFRLVTHALLGLLTFIAAQSLSSLKEVNKQIEGIHIRLALLEDRKSIEGLRPNKCHKANVDKP